MFENLLHSHKDDSERIETVQQKKHELRLIGKEKKIKGHTLYSFNTVTHEIKIAKFFNLCDTIDFATKEPTEKHKLLLEKNCIYRQALNKRNLIKKLKKEGFNL